MSKEYKILQGKSLDIGFGKAIDILKGMSKTSNWAPRYYDDNMVLEDLEKLGLVKLPPIPKKRQLDRYGNIKRNHYNIWDFIPSRITPKGKEIIKEIKIKEALTKRGHDLGSRLHQFCNLYVNPFGVMDGFPKTMLKFYETKENRVYHNYSHIYRCLNEFEQVSHLSKDSNVVKTALWFHDVIYNPELENNEERSAELAEKLLGDIFCRPNYSKGKLFIRRVKNCILATKHVGGRVPKNIDEKLVVDIDLSILGYPEKEFDEYERDIRKEYRQVLPEEIYRVGRIAVLEGFLNKPSIYLSKFFKLKYETKARKNLERLLLTLKGAKG